METITIHTESKTYPVLLGAGASGCLPEVIQNRCPNASGILIITDEKVKDIHLHTVKEAAERTGLKVAVHVVPEGEHAKTFEVFYGCHSFALTEGMNRNSLILALGGGAVGDTAGFAAATFMRGIPFIQIPTTLLAHDSAVGGKVAINHPQGKNMIGAFYQPEAVIYDPLFLKTLPLKELRSGFAEVVKHALIADPAFYRTLLDISDLQLVTEEQMHRMIKRGIEIKADVVSKDEKETGIRAWLNFGHTLGHAVEGAMGYGRFTHGEAVWIGMRFALSLSADLCSLAFNLDEFDDWSQRLGYKMDIPAHLSHADLLARMKKDKKTVSSRVKFVLLQKTGEPCLMEIEDSILLKKMESLYPIL